jgi:spermidine synthase
MSNDAQHDASIIQPINAKDRSILIFSVLITSICALTYELVVGTLSSYLLGNSVTQFSMTIGFFLFAMGIGSFLSRQIKANELRWFIIVELLTGAFGGVSAVILYAVFAYSDVHYYLAMIALSMAIGICVGLEVPLLMRIVAHHEALSNALAHVLSVDYLGALLASLAFPLVFLPLMGVTQTAFIMGMLNVAVACVLLWRFQDRLSRRWVWRLSVMCGVVIIGMVGGTLTSGQLVNYLERQLYEYEIVYTEQSLYQRIVITRSGGDTRLFLDGNLQFSSRDEYRYHELLVHPVMSVARNRETVLVLGGGDGLVARELLKYDDVQQVIVVDLDPAITNLSRRYRPLRELNANAHNDPRVTLVNTDAYNYIRDSDTLFSVIIIDLPDPNNESLSKLYSQTFYHLLNNHLTPDGVFITQATSPYFVREAFWTIVTTIEASDLHAIPLRLHVPSFGEWGFVIGSRHSLPELRVPEGIPLRYLTADVLQATRLFDPDTERVPAEVNTLDNPILPRVYEAGWRRWN